MRLHRCIASLAAVGIFCGVGYALQGRQRPGEVRAESKLSVGGHDVSIGYSTLGYGATTFGRIKSDPNMAKRWAEMLPGLLGGTFQTGTDLAFGDTLVKAGSYDVTFGTVEGGGFELVLLQDKQAVARVPLQSVEAALESPHLNFGLLSVGADRIRVTLAYGKDVGYADGAIAAGDKPQDG